METNVHAPARVPEADRDRPPGPEHTSPTAFVDSDHPAVAAFAARATRGATSDRDRLRRLFAATRDELLYDPYSLQMDPASYRASAVIARGAGYCVSKAVVLAAVCRASGIPARLGFADVRNHLQSPRLAEAMGGSDLFVFHGYTDLYVEGRWRKATPAFNATLCARAGVPPLEFDGTDDALLHPFSGDGSAYMEYVQDRGVYDDLPLQEILDTLDAAYPGMFEQLAANGTVDPLFTETSGKRG